MGASVSVQKLYKNAFAWFKRYFDETMYIEDFRIIDKDHNGGISLREFEQWIREKANHDKSSSTWGFLLNTPEIIKIAHKEAGRYRPDLTVKPGEKIVDVADFRNLLVHLYAISILWVHFKNADDWTHSSDYGNKLLTYDEFCLACHTITEAHAHEKISEEQMRADFDEIEKADPNHLTFLEVCNYCCRFIDDMEDVEHSPTTASSETSTSSGVLTKEASARQVSRQPSTRASEQFLNQKSLRFQSMLMHQPFHADDADSISVGANMAEIVVVTGLNEMEHHDAPEIVLPDDVVVLSKYIEDHLKKDLNTRSSVKVVHQFNSLDVKTEMAIDALGEQLNTNKTVAEFVEVKFNTEHEIHKMLYGH